MQTLIENTYFVSENIRIDRKVQKRESEDEFPDIIRWSVQLSYFDGCEWVPICRADNYLHEGQTGSHIHTYKQNTVKRMEISYLTADKIVKETSARILKEKFNLHID